MNERLHPPPFFSAVIPVFNKGPHVQRSIASVLNQTFQDFELIVIDDASTDNGLEEIRKFKDERIRILQRNEPGPGGYAARNLGIREARGAWVAFLDADDEWRQDHLEKMHELAKAFPDVFLMGCGWQIRDGGMTRENAFLKNHPDSRTLSVDAADYLSLCLSGQQPVWTSVACIKKSSAKALGLFPAESGAKRGGDVHAWLKMICHHKKMAWSNHIGAVYHKDCVNMVTKNAPISLSLLGRRTFRELSRDLDRQEKRWLRKWLNAKLKEYWLFNFKGGHPKISLGTKLFWHGDFKNALMLTVASFMPKAILKCMFACKRMIGTQETGAGD